jgi:hypothetical protein
MDANAYVKKIERTFSDPDGLKAIRKEIQADSELDPDDKMRLSTRVGTYLLSNEPDPPGA